MPTAILSALPEEQGNLVTQLTHAQRSEHAGRAFWRGQLHSKPVVLALSGIGKVAAATTATVLAERFGAAHMVFTGVAGGLGTDVQVGDVVVAQAYLQHDMDASPIFPRWEVPGYGIRLPCDAALSNQLLQAARDCVADAQTHTQTTAHVHHGLIASGDQFISTAHASNALRTDLLVAGHEVLAVEMEGAAVAQVCRDFVIPFAALRTISDRADDSASVDFMHFVRNVASRYSEDIVLRLMQML